MRISEDGDKENAKRSHKIRIKGFLGSSQIPFKLEFICVATKPDCV